MALTMIQDARDWLLKLLEVAALLGIHLDTARERARTRLLPSIKQPGNGGYRVRKRGFDAWLKANAVGSGDTPPARLE